MDLSCFNHISDNEQTQKIISTILDLSQKLKLPLIAEGVETEEQNTLVSESECDYIQGWYYSKALPETKAEDFYTEYIWYTFSNIIKIKNSHTVPPYASTLGLSSSGMMFILISSDVGASISSVFLSFLLLSLETSPSNFFSLLSQDKLFL